MSTRMFRSLGLFVASTVLLVAGCTSDEANTGTPSETGGTPAATPGEVQLITDDTLTVCVDAPKYPFAFQSGEQWLGSDIDILMHLAAELDLELVVVDAPFAGIWQRPNAGECDLAAAAITVTDARRAEAAFSESYLSASQSLLVRKDDEATYAQLSQLEGRQIGVKEGTTSQEYLRSNLPAGARLVTFEDTEAMFVALGARNIDAVFSDLPLNGYRSTLDTAVTVTEVIETGEIYGFAAASSNTGLIVEVNQILDEYRESDDYRSLLSRWFGVR